MKPKNEAHPIPRIGKSDYPIKATPEKRKTDKGEGKHYHTAIQPPHLFPEKDSPKKQLIEAGCRFNGEVSEYLSTVL